MSTSIKRISETEYLVDGISVVKNEIWGCKLTAPQTQAFYRHLKSEQRCKNSRETTLTRYELLQAENEKGRAQVNACNNRISKLIIQLESLRRTRDSFKAAISVNEAKLLEIEQMQP